MKFLQIVTFATAAFAIPAPAADMDERGIAISGLQDLLVQLQGSFSGTQGSASEYLAR